MKKIISVFLMLALVLSTMLLNACGSQQVQESNEVKSDGYEIAIVTDVGSLMDKGFNQGTYEGAEDFAKSKGLKYKYYQPANGNNASDNDRIAAMRQAINNGAKVIVTPGFLQATAIETVAKESPNVKFVFVDGWAMGLPNVTAIVYKEQEAGYFAGYAAVKEGYTKLGGCFGGGGSNPACNRFGYGYFQGANEAAKELEKNIEIKYTFKFGDTFSPSSELQTLISGWYASGTEVVFSCGGGMFDSVKTAASETKDGKIIGVDVDQSGESDRVITSALKGLRQSVKLVLTEYYDGLWNKKLADKAQNLGAAEDATGLPLDTWKFSNFTKDEYDKLYKKVKSGKIAPDDNVPANCNSDETYEELKRVFSKNVTLIFEK